MFGRILTDLFLLAGEPSGDLHGAHLVKALQIQAPQLKIAGIAGPRMRELFTDVPLSMERLQVMGFTDVLIALPRLLHLFRVIRTEILQRQPRAVVFIDYPDFNLRLARSLRRHGYRGILIHFICPTVWAWRQGRIPFMAQHLDLLLTLFPFEKELFASTPLSTVYVGHPLVKAVTTHPPKTPTQNLLAIFPGSRKAVIERNFPLQLTTAKRLQTLYPELKIAISLAQESCRAQLERLSDLPLIEPKYSYDLMQTAHLALATSGTVALELALFHTPTVVQYAIRPFDLFLAQKIFRIHLPHYCIVNILTNQQVFPELFGPNLTAETLFAEAHKLWNSHETRKQCKLGCKQLRLLLGEADASQTAAEAIIQYLTISQ